MGDLIRANVSVWLEPSCDRSFGMCCCGQFKPMSMWRDADEMMPFLRFSLPQFEENLRNAHDPDNVRNAASKASAVVTYYSGKLAHA